MFNNGTEETIVSNEIEEKIGKAIEKIKRPQIHRVMRTMARIVGAQVKAYRSDFIYDIERITKDAGIGQYIWGVRESGTNIAPLFFNDTERSKFVRLIVARQAVRIRGRDIVEEYFLPVMTANDNLFLVDTATGKMKEISTTDMKKIIEGIKDTADIAWGDYIVRMPPSDKMFIENALKDLSCTGGGERFWNGVNKIIKDFGIVDSMRIIRTPEAIVEIKDLENLAGGKLDGESIEDADFKGEEMEAEWIKDFVKEAKEMGFEDYAFVPVVSKIDNRLKYRFFAGGVGEEETNIFTLVDKVVVGCRFSEHLAMEQEQEEERSVSRRMRR